MATRQTPSTMLPDSLEVAPPLPAFDALPGTPRAAALTRLSRLTEHTTSPQRQREDIRDRIATEGWSFDPDADVFEDLDRSAWKPGVRRPGLEALMAHLDRYDVIVFWKLDRAFRSMSGFLRFLEACEANNVGLVSVKEAAMDTTSPWGRFLAYVLMAIAEIESTNTSLRQRSSKEWLVQNGYWAGGSAPYGWRTVGTDDKHWRLQLDPPRAAALRSAIAGFLDNGMSLGAVARWLNSDAAPDRAPFRTGKPRTSTSWTSTTVRELFSNAVLLGQVVDKGHAVLDDEGLPLVTHEPLVDYWTWSRLQEQLLLRRVAGPDQRRTRETLLRGLARCGRCGRSMTGAPEVYGCRTYTRNPVQCAANSVSRKGIEAMVTKAVFARLTPHRIAEAVRRLDLEQRAIAGPDPAAIRRQQLTEALDRLEADRQAGLYDSAAATSRFRKQHRSLATELEQQTTARTTPELPPVAGLLDAGTASIEEGWPTLTISQQRSVLGAVIRRVEVVPRTPGSQKRFNPTRVTIVWADDPE